MRDPEIELARELAANAHHESVTAERLTEMDAGFGRKRLNDNPVFRLLAEGEQPEFLFHAKKQTPIFNGPGAPADIERSSRYQVLHIITDSRWLMVAGNTDGDQMVSIQLEDIKSTNYDTPGRLPETLGNSVFVIELESAHCQIPLANEYDQDDLETLSKYLRDRFGSRRGNVSIDSDEAGYTIAGKDAIKYDTEDVRSRLNRLPDEAEKEINQIVAEVDSVEELIPQLDTLLAEQKQPKETLDARIADANSLDELRQSVETPSERTVRQAREKAENQLSTAREAVDNADPEAVGGWGMNVSRASLPLAVAAPGSTPLWIAASLVLGGAAGVHSSGVEGSTLADIDPEVLAAHVTAIANEGSELDEIDGEVAGTLLGAFTYLGGKMAPEEFVKWIDAADSDAILAGANIGAAYAKREDVDGSQIDGALAGSGLGLLGGYSGFEFQEGSSDEFTAELESYLQEVDEGMDESE